MRRDPRSDSEWGSPGIDHSWSPFPITTRLICGLLKKCIGSPRSLRSEWPHLAMRTYATAD